MDHNYNKSNHHHHNNNGKDAADEFREQNLKAIRRRKFASKYLFWILSLVALAVVAAAFAAYFYD